MHLVWTPTMDLKKHIILTIWVSRPINVFLVFLVLYAKFLLTFSLLLLKVIFLGAFSDLTNDISEYVSIAVIYS